MEEEEEEDKSGASHTGGAACHSQGCSCHCIAHPPPTKYALPDVGHQPPTPQGGRVVVNVVAMVVAVVPVVVVLVGHPEAVVAGVLGWSPTW